MNDPLFTRKTLAEYLVCTPRTIDNLRSRGLPCIMVGDSPRFELPDVLAWLAANPRKSRGADEPLAFDDAEDEALARYLSGERAGRQAETDALGEAIRSYPDPNRRAPR